MILYEKAVCHNNDLQFCKEHETTIPTVPMSISIMATKMTLGVRQIKITQNATMNLEAGARRHVYLKMEHRCHKILGPR